MGAPVLERRARERRAEADSRVVDEDIDVSEALEERRHLPLVGDVKLVVSGGMHLLVREAFGDRLPDAFGATCDDNRAAHLASAFRSSFPDGVFGSSSRKTTSRGYLCGDNRSRTNDWRACSSTG